MAGRISKYSLAKHRKRPYHKCARVKIRRKYMAITETLEAYKTLIESLPSKPIVVFYSFQPGEDPFRNVPLQGDQSCVLLTCGGGPIVPDAPRMVCDAVFAAFIICRSDQDTKGVSRRAMDLGVELSRSLKNYRGNPRRNPNLPKIHSFEEALPGFKSSNNNFSVWQLAWTHWVAFE